MKTYKVVWEIEVDADSPESAALTAQQWLDEGSLDGGWFFAVEDDQGHSYEVDVSKLPG